MLCFGEMDASHASHQLSQCEPLGEPWTADDAHVMRPSHQNTMWDSFSHQLSRAYQIYMLTGIQRNRHLLRHFPLQHFVAAIVVLVLNEVRLEMLLYSYAIFTLDTWRYCGSWRLLSFVFVMKQVDQPNGCSKHWPELSTGRWAFVNRNIFFTAYIYSHFLGGSKTHTLHEIMLRRPCLSPGHTGHILGIPYTFDQS